MLPRRALALLAASLLALGACSFGDSAESRDTSSSSNAADEWETAALAWGDCGDIECATLEVPLDATQPNGTTIGLALTRVRAGDPDRRIGSLLINPGGPGAPGSEFVEQVASALPEDLSDRFDVVGWDPRGTGASSPVDCGRRLDYLFAPDSAPDNPEEYAERETAARQFAADCDRRSHDLIRHVATVDTVRDLDRIRAALGEPKLNFIGLSYGTYIGALYAQAYPDRVRTLVLDGAIDPSLSIDEVSTEQSRGFEESLDAFLADCADDDDCAFHHDGRPRPALDRLRARVDRRPIEGDDGRVLGPTQFDLALAAPLYSGADGYAELAESLRAAERGNPDAMLESFDAYVGRRANGTYSSEWAAFLAISCADGPELAPEALPALEEHGVEVSPTFGASTIGLTLPCSFWPVPPVNQVPTAVTAPDAPPIVVVGTTGDPATPLRWAEGLARELGSARLVTVDGTAHTASFSGNTCLDDALTAYLVRLRPPPVDLHCAA